MTQLAEHIHISRINKLLPKKLTHKREQLKIQFIKEAIRLHSTTELFGIIDFSKSYANNGSIHISYIETEQRQHVGYIVSQILSQKFFSNLSKNENVFFYRFVNICRSLISETDWSEVETLLSNHPDKVLVENINQYIDYRTKISKIEKVLAIS